jgi:hypothetical protein
MGYFIAAWLMRLVEKTIKPRAVCSSRIPSSMFFPDPAQVGIFKSQWKQ